MTEEAMAFKKNGKSQSLGLVKISNNNEPIVKAESKDVKPKEVKVETSKESK